MLSHKVFLHFFNIVFMLCGVSLFYLGIHLISDEHRILLSKLLSSTNEKLAELQKPLFYYVAIGFSVSGLIVLLISLIGCWAAFINKVCVLFVYFSLVILLLLTEFGISLIVTLWPNCVGPNLNSSSLTKVLQGTYGVPEHEEFTIAMDLIQTKFGCCAINNDINYDTSLWRLKGLGKRELTVPLTCCRLSNKNDIKSYLDPKPVNITLCQALQRFEYETSRHLDGCFEKLEQWYREQYFFFIVCIFIIAIVQFLVLLGIILNCTKKRKHSSAIENSVRNIYPKDLPTITDLRQLREDRFSLEANTIGLWSKFAPSQQI